MIISIDTEKNIWKNAMPFYGKTTQQLKNRHKLLNLIKCIHKNPTANTTSSNKRLNAFTCDQE